MNPKKKGLGAWLLILAVVAYMGFLILAPILARHQRRVPGRSWPGLGKHHNPCAVRFPFPIPQDRPSRRSHTGHFWVAGGLGHGTSKFPREIVIQRVDRYSICSFTGRRGVYAAAALRPQRHSLPSDRTDGNSSCFCCPRHVPGYPFCQSAIYDSGNGPCDRQSGSGARICGVHIGGE